jgi:hypothetical protein
MATRRKITAERPDREGTSTPTQQDEADILEEVGAQPDDDGDLVAPEESIRELGAVDADSVRENRRLESIVKKKRANQSNVSFNTGDVISTYDTVIKVWAVNTIEISVRRLTGTPIQRVITTRPRSGAELYEALRLLHGPNEEADYEVKFLDSSRKEWRGKGKITMPDARPPAQQGQPPMGYQYPYGAPPPGYPPQPPFTQPAQAVSYPPQQPPAPGAPPFVVQAPAGPDMAAMMASMRQMFEMFQAMQQPQQPVFAAPSPPQQQSFMPPPPPPGSDMAAQMAWMKQAFDMFQSMQPTTAPARAAPPQTPQSPNPTQGGPNVQPPAGMMWGWIPNFGFALMPAGGGPGPGFGRGPGEPSPYRRPPPYMQEHERHAPQPPPQRERTAAEQFREAMSVVRTAVDAVGEMNTMLPNMQGGAPEVSSGGEDDDSPVKVIDTGRGKFVLDKNNGGFRGWESLYANLPDLLKWAGEQREEIQKTNAAKQPQPQRLPPGYVEVGPDYRPPPGFVAVPEPLPPPPSNMPPPLQHPQQRTWGAPTVPEEEPQ